MSKRLFMAGAVLLFAVSAHGLQVPSLFPGATDDTSTSGQSQSANCSDPTMASSAQCNTGQNGAMPGANGANSTSSTSNSAAQQQNRISTYNDEESTQSANRNGTTLRPEPLTEFQKYVASTTGNVLPIYGARLFQSVPSTFAPVDNSPVPADYVLGPDDELRVRVWGQVNFNANLKVDRAGDIFLPEIGAVHVAGLHFSELEQHVRDAVGKIYRNFQLSVEIGRIRTIQVYVTGEARRPGLYTVSSLSTLINAIFASGGPSVQGSMRSIELRRGGQKITELDMYRLLINGDKSQDAKLLPEDVIFIPAVGQQMAVVGSVARPAIYELLPGDTIGNVLSDAGGVSELATDKHASLDRSMDHSDRTAMDVKLDNAGLSTPLRGGDILHVLSIVSHYQKTVTLRGNTANPGRLAWHEGMRVSDLIPDRDALITRDYWWKRVQMGLAAPEFQPIPALSTLRQPTSPIDLRNPSALQTVQQDSYPNQYPYQQNGLYGQGTLPNSQSSTLYPYANQGSNPQSSENPYPETDLDQANNLAAQQQYAYAAPNQYQNPNQNQNQNSYQYPTNTGPMAEQRQPGSQRVQSALAEPDDSTSQESLTPHPTKKTVVKLVVPEIDWSYAVIERMDPVTLRTKLIPFDLGKLVIDHDSAQDLVLEPGDVVSVFSQSDIHVPIAEQTKFVRLEGEFVHAGTYSAQPGESLRSLVLRAGGLSPNAYLYGSVFTRESTRILQQRRMDEMIQQMTLQMQRGNLALAANPVSTTQDIASTTAAETSERELIAQLQQIRATGRIVFDFMPNTAGTESVPDLKLENGDTFLVPSVPSTVNVLGAVFNQNSFVYRPNAQVRSFLNLAGGPNSDADQRREFVIRGNGAVLSRTIVKGTWGNEFYHLKLYPGDTIIVPEKSIKTSALRGLLDWTQVFSQFAFGAAAINVLR